MSPIFRIGPLPLDKMDQLMAIQERAYGAQYCESVDSFISKIRISPATCLGMYEGEELRSYAITFPWDSNEVVPLNAEISVILAEPDTLYIHDIATDPQYSGNDFAAQFLDHLNDVAKGFRLKTMTLTAVSGAESLWEELGFSVAGPADASYGVAAIKMQREVAWRS